MTAAAIYVRVSSEMQLDGHSLDAQERLCREYCQRHGLAITSVYREEAESASSTERPELQRMLTDARAHVFAAIVFYHTWRFSRSIEDSALMTRLERSGIRLMSVTDAIDSATPAGRLQRNITLAVGQHYLDQLRAETTRGKRERALQGYSNASHPPFGYVRVSDRQNAPGPEAGTVREMFERYAAGAHTDIQIAEWLNAQGKRTAGHWGHRAFSKDTVRAILINPYYIGLVGYRGLSDRETETGKRARASKRTWQWIPGKHEALITPELFDRCRAVRAKRGSRYVGRRASQSHGYILSKMAKCARCGGPLRCMTDNQGEPKYTCTAHDRAVACDATRRSVRETRLLEDLDALVSELSLTEPVKARAIELLESGDETVAADRRRIALDAEMRRLNRMYQAGNIGDGEYDQEIGRVKGELASLAKPADAFDLRAAIAALDDIAGLWRNATGPERAEILRTVFEAVRVDLDAGAVTGYEPKNEYTAVLRAAYSQEDAISGSDGRRFRNWRPRRKS
ncbi:Ser_Recombinase domain containing protein [uncultured Caudovirales phage]|uniref:Ser_Recombinase domain containing protein n=1 Tax=uncultured Caudovirales phage TaxID=2100421 RepID=A0A6J5MMX6_9CAUD|nr:Ser_Recombinase domain containing protein [uncultured Caudovirales phage]